MRNTNSPKFEQFKKGDIVHVAYVSSNFFDTWEKPIECITIYNEVGAYIKLKDIKGVGQIDERYRVLLFGDHDINEEGIINRYYERESAFHVIATSKDVLMRECRNILNNLIDKSLNRAIEYEEHLNVIKL